LLHFFFSYAVFLFCEVGYLSNSILFQGTQKVFGIYKNTMPYKVCFSTIHKWAQSASQIRQAQQKRIRIRKCP